MPINLYPNVFNRKSPPKLRTCAERKWTQDVLVANSPGNEFPWAVVRDGVDGAYFLAIESAANTLHRSLHIRHVTASGVTSPSVDIVKNTSLGSFYEADAAAMDGSTCGVLWCESNNALLLERFDDSINRLWTSAISVSPAAASPRLPVSAADGTGGVLAAFFVSSGANFELRAQRLSAAGSALWAPGGVSVTTIAAAPSDLSRPCLVPDGAGGATVLWQERLTNSVLYEVRARRLDSNGQPTSVTLVIATSADSWGGFKRVRRAVTDGAGGLYLAYVEAPKSLQLVRVQAGASTPAWKRALGVLVEANAFAIATDAMAGALVTLVDETRVVSALRFNSTGDSQWASSAADYLATTNITVPPNAWPGWGAELTAVVPAGNGGAIVFWYDTWSLQSGGKLVGRCVTPDGALDTARFNISGNTANQALQVVEVAEVNTAHVAWTSDGSLATAYDVFAQKVGCCPPTPAEANGGPLELSPFCEIPYDFPFVQPRGINVLLPCGNRRRGFFGLLPLARLAQNVPATNVPGGFLAAGVPYPDWVTLWFTEMPRDFSIELRTSRGRLIAEAESYADEDAKWATRGYSKVLTVRPRQADEYVLVFGSMDEAAHRESVPIRVYAEYGAGTVPRHIQGQRSNLGGQPLRPLRRPERHDV